MQSLNNSRQRNAILDYLRSTKEHPTADTIYEAVREEFPKISLGTVYRNLTLLCSLGTIQKLSSLSGPDRFDYNEKSHPHFECTKCGRVLDINADMSAIDDSVSDDFKGSITGHSITFYGLCPKCLSENN